MIKSWKTTAAGVASILVAGLVAFQQYLSGGVSTIQWEVLVAAVTAGVGLIFAKDANVTGGTVPVNPPTPPTP